MFEHIKGKLKNNGHIPNTIIDIGACYGVFTDKMLDVFPFSKYYLFESCNHPELQKFLVKDNVKVFNVLLNDKDQISEKINIEDMKNVFIKINCKDTVLSILKSVNNILNITNFILLDLPFNNEYNNTSKMFVDCVKFLSEKGFVIFDDIHNYEVKDLKRYNILFISKNYLTVKAGIFY